MKLHLCIEFDEIDTQPNVKLFLPKSGKILLALNTSL